MIPDIIQFKDDNKKLENEWNDPKLHKRLRIVMYALAGYVWNSFKKPLTITEIYRTQEEQDKIYANDPKYKEQKFVSPHQVWRAIDLRCSYFTDDELKKIKDFLSTAFIYNTKDPKYKIILIHDIGFGNHLHIQVSESNTQLV